MKLLYLFKGIALYPMVQLTAKFTLVCAIHACVVQFYSSDLSKLMCHTQVRLLVLQLSWSQVLHES